MARLRLKRRSSLAVVALPLVMAACPGNGADEPSAGGLIVGVQSDDFGPLVSSVHVLLKQDNVIVTDETLPLAPGQPSPLPKEYPLSGNPGERVEVSVEATSSTAGAPPLVSRLASTRLVATTSGVKKLLRVQLDSRCVVFPGATNAPASCVAPSTCVAGACVGAEVFEDALESYEPNWPLTPPDICRPANHGPPEVRIGTGQTDYNILEDGQVLKLEKGPQGGHHIWIAARMRNLLQSGSITAITSSIEGDPTPVPPTSYVFTFDRDEGSFCKISGLRYQLDAGATDLGTTYKRFLGKRLIVTVEVKDRSGASASSTKTIQIADKILCPNGTEAESCSAS